MQIDKKYRLEKAVSTDDSRESLANISGTHRHAVACNGTILAIVPITQEKADEPGWMTPSALVLARKTSLRNSDNLSIGLNGIQELANGSTLKRPSTKEVRPPSLFQMLLRAHRSRQYKVGLNVDKLRTLVDALGTKEIILEFGEPDAAILVRPLSRESGVRGLIMPIRLNRERN